MASNASTAFPSSLLSAFASLSNHFFKTLSFLGGEPPAPWPPPPETPVIATAIVKEVIERVVSAENMVIPCSLNRVQIFFNKDVY